MNFFNALGQKSLRAVWLGVLLLGSLNVGHAQIKSEKPQKSVVKSELKTLFDDRKVSGSITVYDSKKDLWYFSGETDPFKGDLPASTFKIPNLLIALETGVIQSTTETVLWNNRKLNPALYGERKAIERDMTVEEAFRE